jgi:tyrosinase
METYYSHLSDRNSQSNYTDRAPNSTLKDIAIYLDIGQDSFWLNSSVNADSSLRDLIHQDIRNGHLISSDGSLIGLDRLNGTDLLGESVESSVWTVNPQRYSESGIHNNGHALISYVMDPISPTGDAIPGVMIRPSTSMRDPIFYRWHTLVENIILEHKNLLDPYLPYSPDETNYPLEWTAIQIRDFRVIPEGSQAPENELKTFWSQKQLNFSRGLDWAKNASSDPILVCPKHLDHVELDYEISVEKFLSPTTNATVRIYLAPRYDANSNRFSMEEQRGYFFTLDQFSVRLSPGINRIVRNSRNSSLTIPFETWNELEEEDVINHNCGCGWPHHLLLPKGSAVGTTYDLFVMITEGEEETQSEGENTCRLAPMWCGIRGKKYPSRFPLGYPFDRRPYSVDGQVVANLDEYVQGIPNMSTVQVRIQHLEN